MTDHSIGIDISKDHLDAHRLIDGQSRRFTNDKAGHKALINWIGGDVVRVVYEPTGPYHRKMEEALAKAGLPLVKVNPRQARRFFEGAGQLAKTDRLDAAMLARMGSLLAIAPRLPRTELLNELKDLHMAREALVKDSTAAKNRAKNLSIPLLKCQNAERVAQIGRQKRAIEAEIMSRIEANSDLAASFAILTSIPGVSVITAFALIIDMPELGKLEAAEAAALAGLAPVTRQSGKWRGRAFIRGGRANLRQALYMPALVATRFNPDFSAKYNQLKENGKPPKVAIAAIMRKLVILANALLKADRKWTPKTA
jgi:transposase